jgi:hypothetical protein
MGNQRNKAICAGSLKRAVVQGGVRIPIDTPSVTLKLGEKVSSYRSQNKGYVERSNPSDYSGRGRILPVVS